MLSEVWARYGRSFLIALGLHTLLAFCLLFNFFDGQARSSRGGGGSNGPPASIASLEPVSDAPAGAPVAPSQDLVQAVAVDEKAVVAEVERLDLQDQKRARVAV